MFAHNIAVWNIRGGHSTSKLLEIRNLVKENNIQLIGICETKLNLEETLAANDTIMYNWSIDHNIEHAPYGRLFVMWNPRTFTLNKLASSVQYLHYNVLHKPTSTVF